VEIVSDTVNRTEIYPSNYLANFVAEIQDFQESVQEGRDPVASGIDGLRVVEATLAMIESATTGRTIKINPVAI
jgi:predicted dehydrogenase